MLCPKAQALGSGSPLPFVEDVKVLGSEPGVDM